MMELDRRGELETALYRHWLPDSRQSPRQAADPLRESNGFSAIAGKMLNAGLPVLAVRAFEQHYSQLHSGMSGYIPSDEALPIRGLLEYGDLDRHLEQIGAQALNRTVVLKLNGGLGTTMGLNGPKSMLIVKEGLSFLEITVRQILSQRVQSGARLPFVLMNSFSTHEQTLAALRSYPDFQQDIPTAFMQHRIPKIRADTLSAVTWTQNRAKEWCPPGHGDIYAALTTSNVLPAMLEAGYEYLFVSNSDNLGAAIDNRILGHFVEARLPFLMEVAYRTLSDRKGGHLARRQDGRLCLRESAQCPPDEIQRFMDVERYQYFNTNNLWLHLPTLNKVLQAWDYVLPLPLIRNTKNVDPGKADSPQVYQLETAVGSAISLFEGAEALCVPRSRFIPVKINDDLVRLRSHQYRLTDDYRLEATPQLASLSREMVRNGS